MLPITNIEQGRSDDACETITQLLPEEEEKKETALVIPMNVLNRASYEDSSGDHGSDDGFNISSFNLPPHVAQLMRQITEQTITIHRFLKIIGNVHDHHDLGHYECKHHGHYDGDDKLISFSELPKWYGLNIFIIHGYRVPDISMRDCIRSMREKNNETGNIWTEFFPGIVLMAFFFHQCIYNKHWILYFYHPQFECTQYKVYQVVTGIAFIPILLRPFISGCAHCFHPISEKCYNRWWKADYVSIVWATMASAANFAVCELHCNIDGYFFGLIFLTALSLVLTIVICTSKADENSKLKEKLMAVMLSFEFWLLFLYAIQAVLRAYIANDELWTNNSHFWYYMYWLLAICSSFIAAFFRVTQCPERCILQRRIKKAVEKDGNKWSDYKKVMKIKSQERSQEEKSKLYEFSKYIETVMKEEHLCDYAFTSHQWWHIFVNISVFFQIFAWIKYWHYRSMLEDSCC